MQTKVMGVRDLVREGKRITKYDYVDIIDKKSKEYRGVFVSFQYAEFVKDILGKKKQKRIDKIMKFSGMADGLFKNKTVQKIKSLS